MLWLKRGKFGTVTPTSQQLVLQEDLRRAVDLLRTAKGDGGAEAFAALLRALDDNRDAIEQGVVAWVNLVEIVVQGAEQRYPDGNGPVKKSQVVAALHRIVDAEQITIPHIPAYLQPVVMDLAVEWTVEVVVGGINGYDLWDDSRPMPNTLAAWIWAGLARLLRLLRPLAELLSWLYVRLRYFEPLTPELEAAVDRVIAADLLGTKKRLLGTPAALIRHIAAHGPQIIAATRLLFEVVHHAEQFSSLSGPGKKAYARDLVLAAMSELGLDVEDSLFGPLIVAFIDTGIESAFSLMSRRAPEMFAPARTA